MAQDDSRSVGHKTVIYIASYITTQLLTLSVQFFSLRVSIKGGNSQQNTASKRGITWLSKICGLMMPLLSGNFTRLLI